MAVPLAEMGKTVSDQVFFLGWERTGSPHQLNLGHVEFEVPLRHPSETLRRQTQSRSGSQWKVWVEKSESGVTSRHDNRSLALEDITRPPEDGVYSCAQLKCSTRGEVVVPL